jgi:glycosyltransferase involved in cell wall biosynthesis/predicted metal-dependent phosphoesterase TrpH
MDDRSSTSRADLHVHSEASQESRLGVQRALGLPECATPPEEVYELAKRRGMDFVTLTDHDTIAGAVQLADRYADAFISVELTAWFRGEPQAVHILCFGLTPDDHERLQELALDVEAVAEYLHEREIACALAHPFYAVSAPLLPRHRRRLAQLFPVWETRNGSRAPELNSPAAVYIDTHGGIGIGGTDDHAGVDVGRTYTETPYAADPAAFLSHIRGGLATARGEQGSAARWTHAAMALAVRALGRGEDDGVGPDPMAVLRMVERVVSEGDARTGTVGTDLGPEDARALLRAWLRSVELDGVREHELLEILQADDFHHAALGRRARRCHERALRHAVTGAMRRAGDGVASLPDAAAALFEACIPAIPYAPASAFLGREKARLAPREGEPPRVALVADGLGAMHGVTRTIDELRQRGVPGFDVEVIGTDAHVDRRLSAVAEVEVPSYPGLTVGVPSLPAVVEALSDGRYDLIHVCAPGPAGAMASVLARLTAVPVVASFHTELSAYARLRTGDPRLEAATAMALALFYGSADHVLSPSAAADASLRSLGVPDERIGRWDRGVDVARFGVRHRTPDLLPGERTVLYAGRLTREKGIDLLADAFLAARERDPRLHLALAGGGPEEGALRERLGDRATFLGWLEGDDLARAYASADVFLFASRTDTFGQVVLEAQASGLPVVAVDEGGPTTLIRNGVSGLLRPADAQALGTAVAELAADAGARERLARGGLAAVADRTWERATGRLAAGYRAALAAGVAGEARHVA